MTDTTPHPGPVVLVLSGGGVYGAAQAGMLEVLCEAGFQPDVIVGVSAGAMNGVYMAQDFTPARARDLVLEWYASDKKELFPTKPAAQVMNVIRRRDSLHAGTGVRQAVARYAPEDLSSTQIPVFVGATSLKDGVVHWWSSGDAVQRVCASTALPGVFPPVAVQGEMYVDGGVLCNVPVLKAVELHASRVICLEVRQEAEEPELHGSALSVLLRSFALTRHELQRLHLSMVPPTVELHHVVAHLPRLAPYDFSQSRDLADAGRRVMREYLSSSALLNETLPIAAGHKRRTVREFLRRRVVA